MTQFRPSRKLWQKIIYICIYIACAPNCRVRRNRDEALPLQVDLGGEKGSRSRCRCLVQVRLGELSTAKKASRAIYHKSETRAK